MSRARVRWPLLALIVLVVLVVAGYLVRAARADGSEEQSGRPVLHSSRAAPR